MTEPTTEDRLAIYELYARYSWALDTGDTDGYVALFTEDAEATEETRDGTLEVRKGRAEIRKLVLKFHDRPDFPGHQHQMAQFVFEADPQGRPDHWVVRSYAWATINHPPQPPHLHWCGHVRDVLAKVDGRWLIRSKQIMGWAGKCWNASTPADRSTAAWAAETARPAKPQACHACARQRFGGLFVGSRSSEDARYPWHIGRSVSSIHLAMGRRATGVSLALAMVVLVGCSKTAPPSEPAPTVIVSAPIVREVRDWDDYAGRFEAVDAVEIRPRVSGMLQEVHFRDGQNVKKGQLLFTIDPRPIEALLAQSRAQLARAKAAQANADASLRRGKTLSQNHLISEADLELLSATQLQAAADVAAAEAEREVQRAESGIHARRRAARRVRSPVIGSRPAIWSKPA